jgi:putative ABC transport system permease protein
MTNRRDRDLDDEIETHLEMAARDRLERGESPEAARAHVLREFGNVAHVKDAARAVWTRMWLERLVQDVRYGLRLLARSPGFTAVALACIGLGVGVTTTIFAAVNALLLQPLPYSDSSELAVVRSRNLSRSIPRASVSWPDMVAWRDQSGAFADIGVYSPTIIQLADPGLDPERVAGAEISPGVLAALRIAPVLGRNFVENDQQFGSDDKVLLSHPLWQRRYGGDPAIVGRMIRAGSPPGPVRPHEVVGVLPPGIAFPEGTDVWRPAQIDIDQYAVNGSRHFFGAIGRLRPRVSRDDAQRALDLISARLQAAYPQAQTGWDAVVSSLRDELVGDLRSPVLLFQGAAVFVLLVACANMASLMLARAGVRVREIGVRSALGASRGRIARQLLTESLVLASAGGVVGVALAAGGIRLLEATLPVGVPGFVTMSIDRGVVLFAIAVTVASGIAFGVVPVLRTNEIDLGSSLGVRAAAGGPSSSRGRRIFTAFQVAASLVLVIGAALLAESRFRVMNELGYERRGVLWVSAPTPPDRYEGPPREAFFQTLEARLRTLPGVEAIGRAATGAPLGNAGRRRTPVIADAPLAPAAMTIEALVHEVTPGYFEAIGVPVVRGRGFTADDRPASEDAPVFPSIVNETFARRFPDNAVVGREVTAGIPGAENMGRRRFRIVGVVRDFRQERLPAPIPPAMYIYAPFGMSNTALAIRTSLADPHDLDANIRAIVRQIDPAVPVAVIQTFDEALARGLWRERAHERVVGIFAALAIVLATIGVYGVISFIVSQRLREFGVRIALGADRRAILSNVLTSALWPTLAGLAAGVLASLALTRFLADVLHDVPATDPATFIAGALAVGATTMFASVAPARRAANVDPVVTLRAE